MPFESQYSSVSCSYQSSSNKHSKNTNKNKMSNLNITTDNINTHAIIKSSLGDTENLIANPNFVGLVYFERFLQKQIKMVEGSILPTGYANIVTSYFEEKNSFKFSFLESPGQYILKLKTKGQHQDVIKFVLLGDDRVIICFDMFGIEFRSHFNRVLTTSGPMSAFIPRLIDVVIDKRTEYEKYLQNIYNTTRNPDIDKIAKEITLFAKSSDQLFSPFQRVAQRRNFE